MKCKLCLCSIDSGEVCGECRTAWEHFTGRLVAAGHDREFGAEMIREFRKHLEDDAGEPVSMMVATSAYTFMTCATTVVRGLHAN